MVADRLTVTETARVIGIDRRNVLAAVKASTLPARRTRAPGVRGGWIYTVARADAEAYRDRDSHQRPRARSGAAANR